MNRWLNVWLMFLAATALVFEVARLILPGWFTFLFTNCLVWCILGNFAFQILKHKVFTKRVSVARKAIFISGCDSGFGYYTARLMDRRGFYVYAGCLFPTGDGATQLSKECSDRLRLVQVDVSKDESVEKAKDFVEKNLDGCELWAIVNNAGVYRGLDVDFTKMSEYLETMNVNTFGQLRVTKAFLPMLKRSKGRIVNINSLAGRVSPSHMSAYVMSKHASVAFTECLRQEMALWRINVISIEPEFFKTPMTNANNLGKYVSSLFDQLDDVTKLEYGAEYFKRVSKILVQTFGAFSSPKIECVTDAIESAICLQHPSSTYTPCGNLFRRCIFYLAETLPSVWVDAFLKFFLSRYRLPKPRAERKLSTNSSFHCQDKISQALWHAN